MGNVSNTVVWGGVGVVLILLLGGGLSYSLSSLGTGVGSLEESASSTVPVVIDTNRDNTLQNDIVSLGVVEETDSQQPPAKNQEEVQVKPKPLASLGVAHEISTPNGFLNTSDATITLEGLRKEGKVVMLSVWSSSCVQCLRAQPYLNAWYEKYAPVGLEVVGLHTPEFSFERAAAVVSAAINTFGIAYPVVLDDDYSTWDQYGTTVWPSLYLIDTEGHIVARQLGEGGYRVFEEKIQQALEIRRSKLSTSPAIPKGVVSPENVVSVDVSNIGSPDIYFGSTANTNLGNGPRGQRGTFSFTLPENPSQNVLYLGGKWGIGYEYAQSAGSGTVLLRYNAKQVYVIARADQAMTATVLLDGKPVPDSMRGKDLTAGASTVTISEGRAYHLISGDAYGSHQLEIQVPGNVELFLITFG